MKSLIISIFLTVLFLLPVAEAAVVLNATDYIGFNISASELAKINSGGLVVTGGWVNSTNFNASNQICLGNICKTTWPSGALIGGSGSPGQVTFWTAADTISGDNNLFWDNTNKRLGIGTTAPASKLNVVGSGGIGRSVMIDNREIKFRGDNVAHISIFGPDTGRSRLSISRSSSNSAPGTEDAELMVIESGGNVGIGTTAPGERLEVAGNVKITGSRIRSSAGYGIVQTDATDWLRINPDSNYPAIALYNPVAIGTGGLAVGEWSQQSSGVLKVTQSAYLATAGGNVGIGTTTPSTKLDIQGGDLNVSGAINSFTLVRVNLTGKSGSAGRDAYSAVISSDNTRVSFICSRDGAGNCDGFQFWSADGGAPANLLASKFSDFDENYFVDPAGTTSAVLAGNVGIGIETMSLPTRLYVKTTDSTTIPFQVEGVVNGYRKPITIDNTQNSNTLTDYQVLVTLDTASLITAGKMRSDCGDIRFTDSDSTSLINHWLESGCNTASTKIWVKVPSIPASSTKTIYVHYGNPSATSVSNARNTMFIYEDMETAPSGTLAGNATYDSTNKWVRLTPASRDQLGYLYYDKNPGSLGFYSKFRFWVGGGNGADAVWLGVYDSSYSNTHEDIVNGGYHFTYDEYQDRICFTKSTGGNGGPTIGCGSETTIDNSAWHTGEIYYWKSGSAVYATIYYDGTLKVNASDSSPQSNALNGIGQTIWGGRTATDYNEHRIDDLIIRKYTSPAPTTSVGSESSAPYPATFFYIQTNGNIGIGTTTPNGKLHIIGSGSPDLNISEGTACSYIDAGATSFTVCSSKDIKENIKLFKEDDMGRNVVASILDRISSVPVYRYDFINGSRDNIGLLAEDFYKVFERGDGKTIKGDEVQMALWLAVQELIKENKQLKSELERLEAKVLKLESK